MRGPCFVLSHNNYESDETSSSLFDLKGNHICCISQLQNNTIMASCDNWLLVISNENPRRNFFLCNSVSYETINLPWLENSELDQYSYIFTSVPTDPNSLIILCDKLHPRLKFCNPGSKRWTDQNISEELYIHGVGALVTLENAVSVRGKVYALSTYNTLFEITVINSNKLLVKYVEEARFPDIPWLSTTMVQKYLVESCGELLMVFKIYWKLNAKEISRVMVFKLDFSTMNWVKMKSLKDEVLFLGDNYSISCTASDYPTTKGNSIYFMHNGILYSFNMEYGSLSLSTLSFQSIREFHRSNWIILPIRLEERCDEEKNEKIKEEAEERNLSDIPSNVLDLSFDVEFGEAAPSNQWTYIESEKELSPWFMLFKNDGEACNIIDSNPKKHSATYLINFPEYLSGATIHFSKNGWLLMSTANDSFHFFNPCTKMIRSLPKMNPIIAPFHIGFSSSPTSPDCLVVGVRALSTGTVVCFIRLRGEEWEEWGLRAYWNQIIKPSNNTPVFYDNRFWVLDEMGKLGVVREGENDNDFIWEVHTQLQSPCLSFESNYIVECGGKLLSVFVGGLGKWVKVFKLDYPHMAWLEVKSLGKNMIFVSRSSCFSAVAKFIGMENKIYFPRLRGQSILFYSLKTEKFHSFTHEESTDDFQTSSFPLHCAWIEPRWQ